MNVSEENYLLITFQATEINCANIMKEMHKIESCFELQHASQNVDKPVQCRINQTGLSITYTEFCNKDKLYCQF